MSAKDKEKLIVPKESPTDVLHSVGKGALSSIPGVGNILAEMKEYIFPSPIQIRRDEWMEMVSSCLIEVRDEMEGFSLLALKDNPHFISIVMHASLIAERTHREEKIQGLRNAVKNTAKGTNINESMQELFLHYIDELTPLHLKLVKFLHDPQKWFDERDLKFLYDPGGIGDAIEIGIPELENKRIIYDAFVDDLNTRGLVKGDRRTINISMSKSGVMTKRTTQIGEDFLRYFGFI